MPHSFLKPESPVAIIQIPIYYVVWSSGLPPFRAEILTARQPEVSSKMALQCRKMLSMASFSTHRLHYGSFLGYLMGS